MPIKAMSIYQRKRTKPGARKYRSKGALKYRSYALLIAILLFCFVTLALLRSGFADSALLLQSGLLQSITLPSTSALDKSMLNTSASFIETDKAQQLQARLSTLKMHNAMRFVRTQRSAQSVKKSPIQSTNHIDSNVETVLINNIEKKHLKSEHIDNAVSSTSTRDSREIEQKIAQWEAQFQSKMNKSNYTAG